MMKWEEEYSEQFDELAKNRVKMSYHKYGSAKNNYKTGNVNALESMKLCVQKYLDTGNTEYLVDARNYLMFEFMYPQHPNAFFKATKSEESAGIVGLCENEAKRFNEENKCLL